ncbi:hypothetical protein OE749_13900 [Aestuariibacter sp. AA17]|uniref:MSHA biogenesis protein MshN n=1 Tax=Fluctibacter corallii TaxID=2984329 RepID=A0ABT3AAT4_9ALTE|nr:tetratricopeptide repeat protein [Aestuariibacter sp. AA17]MCV2885786.1 hypothetical protein [Aestuariibacter sp. AA17]
MSVVNKMLKDLDARQHTQQQQADYQPSSSSATKPVLVVLVVVISIIMAWVFIPAFSDVNEIEHSERAGFAEPVINSATKLSQVNERQAKVSNLTNPRASVVPKLPSDVGDIAELGVDYTDPSTTSSSEVAQPTMSEVKYQHNVESDTVTATDLAQTMDAESIVQPDTQSEAIITAHQPNDLTNTQLRQQIRLAVQTRDHLHAIALLNTLIQREPENVDAIKQQASLLFAVGDSKQAIQTLETAIVTFEQKPELRMMLARLFHQLARPRDALTVLNVAIPMANLSLDYIALRANLAMTTEQFEIALQDYQYLVTASPEHVPWWIGYAISSERMGHFHQAHDAYLYVSQSAELTPDIRTFVSQRIAYLTEKTS